MAVDTNVTDYDNILLQEGVLSTLSHVNFHVARLIIVDFTPKEDIQCQIWKAFGPTEWQWAETRSMVHGLRDNAHFDKYTPVM